MNRRPSPPKPYETNSANHTSNSPQIPAVGTNLPAMNPSSANSTQATTASNNFVSTTTTNPANASAARYRPGTQPIYGQPGSSMYSSGFPGSYSGYGSYGGYGMGSYGMGSGYGGGYGMPRPGGFYGMGMNPYGSPNHDPMSPYGWLASFNQMVSSIAQLTQLLGMNADVLQFCFGSFVHLTERLANMFGNAVAMLAPRPVFPPRHPRHGEPPMTEAEERRRLRRLKIVRWLVSLAISYLLVRNLRRLVRLLYKGNTSSKRSIKSLQQFNQSNDTRLDQLFKVAAAQNVPAGSSPSA